VVVSVSGSRGCFRKCRFCSIRAFYREPSGPPWRYRSVSNIIKEIEELYSKYKVKEVAFVDDIFFGAGEKGRQKRIQLADELISQKLPISLALAESADEIDEHVFKHLYKAGLRQVLLGLESGSQKMLDYLGKGTTTADGVRAVTILKKLGIDLTVSFINFTPETTIDDLRKNIAYFQRLKINFLQGLLNRLQVYKGTDIEKRLRKEGILHGDTLMPSYTIKDYRVESIYQTCTQTLGKYLSISYEIKRVERAFRIIIFQRSFEGKDVSDLLKKRKSFDDCVQLILKECAKIFLDIIDCAEKDISITETDSFIDELKNRLYVSYGEWINLTNLFWETLH